MPIASSSASMLVGDRDERGFTLIEMIVVLAVLGIMAGAIVSRGPMHSQRLDLDGAAREMTTSLRLGRSRAIAQNRTVIWRPDPGGYSLDGAPPRALPKDVVMTVPGAIGFTADGSSTGGLIVLRAGDLQIAIEVDWLTGRVALAGDTRMAR